MLALDDADFDLRRGQISALPGKNGAGKSTLIRLLTGAEEPDRGTVLLDDQPLTQSAAQRAAEAYGHGVRVVYQELSLVPDMTVAKNLFLGRWPGRGGVIDMAAMRREAREAVDRISAAGIAVVYVSHRMDKIRQIADSVTVLREGRIADEMTAPDIHQDAIFAACLASDDAA